ncbi:MAG: tetratricopeptide repeat protein, partial [Candidatus Sulfotelmatobacter sp.]
MRVSRFSASLLVVAIVCRIAVASPQAKPSHSAVSTAYQTGIDAMTRGDLPAARDAFEKAVKLSPRDVDAQNMLGHVLLQQGAVDDAIARFRTVVQLQPSLAIAHAYLAQALETRALETQGRLDDAVAEFRIAVQLAPGQWQAHQSLGRELSLQNKTDDAIAEFNQAIRLAPQQPELHDQLGALFAQQSQFANAESEFREALRLSPDFEPAYFHLGAALSAAGETKKAQEMLDHAVQL